MLADHAEELPYNPSFRWESKTHIWEGSFREKSKNFKKRSKNRKFEIWGGHNFLLIEKLVAAAYAEEIRTICSIHRNHNLRFGSVVFEKSQVSKKRSKNGKFDFYEGHNFHCKKV